MTDITAAIQTELKNTGGCKRRLSVTIPAEIVAREFDEIVAQFARSARIPGFRQGKVPADLVRRRFAKEISEEVGEHLVREGLAHGLEEHGVRPLHDPVLESESPRNGEPFLFSVLFESAPDLHLGEYKGLSVAMPEPVVGEDDIDRAVDQIRDGLARFVSVEPRPVVKGDFAVLDLEGRVEPAATEPGSAPEAKPAKTPDAPIRHQNVVVELGAEGNVPDIDKGLDGMAPGETRTFPVHYPDDYGTERLAGKTVVYQATLKEIKRRELPAADDELPKDLGKEGTLADLREEIRGDLLAARKRASEAKARDQLLRQLIERHPVEVPEVMVEDQVSGTLEELARSLASRGVDPSRAEINWKEIRDKELPLARQRVLGLLILDEIARREAVEVSEPEISRRIAEEVARRGRAGEEVRKRLDRPEMRQVIKNQLVREKSLDFLLKNATITQ